MGSIRAELPERGELSEPASAEPPLNQQVLARVEHTQRVADLRALKPRERRDLYLHALGYRYNEIAQATGSSYTAVDRRLKEGRAQLRRLAREREESDDQG